MCIFKNKHMKLIIKNDSKETVKNPNVKIIETTEASFTNQTVFIEENDVPIIKYTDTEDMYFVKNLDNLYDRKSRSEVLLNITIDNLELIGGGSSEPVDSRPYKVYTALLTQLGTNAPIATVLENTLGDIAFLYSGLGQFQIVSDNLFTISKTCIFTSSSINIGEPYSIYTDISNSNAITLQTLKLQESPFGEYGANEVLYNSSIEIRVYN